MKPTFALPIVLSTAVNVVAARDSDCKDVHIFLAKGNNEPYPGRQGKLAGAICSGLSSCDYEDIQFYNPLESVYCESVFEGAKNGIQQITDYNKRCPDSKLVVSGYSQGGHIVGDILGGGGGVFFQDCVQGSNKGLDPASRPANKIVAAMIFGDTRHTANQPYNVFSGANSNGLFPRPAEHLANLAKYGDVLRAYCVETDPICAKGDEVETHLNYFDVYTDEVAGWVKERVKEDGDESTTQVKTKTEKSSATKKSAEETSTKEEEDAEQTSTASKVSKAKNATTTKETSSDTEETSTSTSTSTTKASSSSSPTESAAETSKSTTDQAGSQTEASSADETASPQTTEPLSANAASGQAVPLAELFMGLGLAAAFPAW